MVACASMGEERDWQVMDVADGSILLETHYKADAKAWVKENLVITLSSC